MQKYLFWALFSVCLMGSLSAQSIDSLQTVLLTMPEDTNKVMTYRLLYRALYANDRTEELLDVSEKGLSLSRKLDFSKGLSLFIFYKASALDILGRGRESIPIFEEGLQLAQSRGDKKSIADFSSNIGTAYYTLGDQEKALQSFLMAYSIYKELSQQENLSKVLNNIGIIYRTQGKHERAEEIYRESLAIKQGLKDTLGMAASYQNLAAVMSTSNREPEMIGYLQQALAIYEQKGRSVDAAGCYALLSQIYFNLGKLKETKDALAKAKAAYDQKPSIEYSSNVYRMLGSVAEQEKNYAQAEGYFLEAAKWARQFGQQERLWDILNELSKTQYLLGKGSAAYQSLREAFAIRDTVTEKNRLGLIAEMQTKFDVVQKDNDLKINQLDLNRRTLERNWFIAGAVALGLLSVLIFFGLRSRIRANKKIAAQESVLQKQQIVQLEQAGKLNTLSAMIEGQEKERSRIAADLHDGLGGLLTSVKSHFNSLPTPNNELDLFHKTNRLIDDACGEVRRISHNMMPRALALSGLSGALEDLAQDLDKQGVRCDLEMIGLEQLPYDNAQFVLIYRIIQELSNNVVKHAQADHLLLQLICSNSRLTIIAEDNGKGFDVQQALSQKGMGLSSIASRVKFLQGTIAWDSVLGEGTMVSIELPICRDDAE